MLMLQNYNSFPNFASSIRLYEGACHGTMWHEGKHTQVHAMVQCDMRAALQLPHGEGANCKNKMVS